MTRPTGWSMGLYALAALLLGVGEASAEAAKSRAAAINAHAGAQARHSDLQRGGASERGPFAAGNPAQSRPFEEPTRNAIGAAVPRNAAPWRSGMFGGRPSLNGGAAAAPKLRPSPSAVGVVIPFGNRTFGHSTASLTSSAALLRRASIGGPGFARAGTGLSGLGGPAKSVDGINGTVIRPKR